MVLNCAYDIDSNGIDNYTGYGRLDAVAELKADPDYFVEARISKIKVVQVKGQQAIQIFGTVASNNLKFGQLSIGKGANPEKWLKVKTKITEQKINASLLALPAKVFATSKQWTLKLIVEDLDGNKREANFALTIG